MVPNFACAHCKECLHSANLVNVTIAWARHRVKDCSIYLHKDSNYRQNTLKIFRRYALIYILSHFQLDGTDFSPGKIRIWTEFVLSEFIPDRVFPGESFSLPSIRTHGENWFYLKYNSGPFVFFSSIIFVRTKKIPFSFDIFISSFPPFNRSILYKIFKIKQKESKNKKRLPPLINFNNKNSIGIEDNHCPGAGALHFSLPSRIFQPSKKKQIVKRSISQDKKIQLPGQRNGEGMTLRTKYKGIARLWWWGANMTRINITLRQRGMQ
jgi:hypothetical protein